jgi:asparagine synthase (glutamine-hydrolysing)
MRRLRRPGAPSAPAWDPISFLNPDLARSFGFREIARNPPPPHRNERERHVRLLERELMVKIVEVLDHTSAAFNVEVRFPFMDVRLIEYCVSLPSDQKFRGATTRYVMHAGMAGVLPDKIQQRGDKSDLGPSFEKGLFKFERETLGKKILQEADQLAPYLNLGLVKQCLDRYQNGTASETDFLTIWRAIGVALWLRSRRTDTGQFIQRRKEVK